MMEWLQMGGLPAYALVCFSFLSHPLGIASAVFAFAQRRRGASIGLGAATLLIAVVTLTLGVGGYLWGMHHVDMAVAHADPEHREIMRRVGQSEAMVSLWCGLASAAIPALTGALALARGLSLPRDTG